MSITNEYMEILKSLTTTIFQSEATKIAPDKIFPRKL